MTNPDNKTYDYLSQAHPQFIEALYKQYRENPDNVEFGWKKFFEGFELGRSHSEEDGGGITARADTSFSGKEFRVVELIFAYRRRGHLFTRTNPVRTRRQYSPTLALENFGLAEEDLDTTFEAGREIGIGPKPLRDIIAHLEETYCKSIGAEYRFIREPEKIKWLEQRMESTRNRPDFSKEEKKRILEQLNRAVVFENFLHTRFVGHKRFALSGGETIIPGLEALIDHGAELGTREFVFGMPHRGRLNVLANIMRKSHEEIFTEFEGKDFSSDKFIGDVKYHLGFTNAFRSPGGKAVTLNMVPNPSHLEAVTPYVQGVARSKIDNKYKGDINKVVPVLIHGDAAIAAQGVVYEVIQMSQLEAYHTGGTIHLVINNQLGFTTNYLDGRSSTYCTDVAKVTSSPVFHVNADDAEAVVLVAKLAMEYRRKFHTDVFIDLLGYRKYGHNEADEPRFTQPALYKEIARHPDPRDIYFKKLLEEKAVPEKEKERLEKEYRRKLGQHLETVKGKNITFQHTLDDCDKLARSVQLDFESSPTTAVEESALLAVGKQAFHIPKDIEVIGKLRKLYEGRQKQLLEAGTCDWAMGEALAYATLLNEGVNIRISGQDSERGTFSHRHAVLHVENTDEEYTPLKEIDKNQGRFEIYNSLLSEFGVLGFEFGYACVNPGSLTIWEAQFGDFINGAQVTIDEFITASEAKWGKMNCLVMLLPHGYEGQGPDHSSARMERFLQLCANDNIQVANCSTPASFFHLLRRHMKWPFRVPLIIFSPKSLLRHPLCVSRLDEFTGHDFLPVLEDTEVSPEAVRRVLFCSGKIYYELFQYREKEKIEDTAIVRLEQLYPFPEKHVRAVLARYPGVESYTWVQEEPENMGAWGMVSRKFPGALPGLVARRENSSPASGFYAMHLREQQGLVEAAFGKGDSPVQGVFVQPGRR